MFTKQHLALKLTTVLYLSLALFLAHTVVFASQVFRPTMPTSSTWGVRTQFISGSGSVAIRWSGEYYQHIGTTSGFNISSSGKQTPALVKVQTQSYELSDVRTTPCQNRTTGVSQSYSSVSNSTSLQSANPCGGSNTSRGWHNYYGNGFHWVGSFYGTTNKLN